MKVAMVAPFPYTAEEEYGGGIIQVVLRLSEALSKIPEIELFVVSQSVHVKTVEHYSDRAYHRIYFPRIFPGFDWLTLKYGMTLSLKKIIMEIKPDIIHVQGNPDYILSVLRIKNISTVVTIHGIYANEYKIWKSNVSFKEIFVSMLFRKSEEYYFKKIGNLIAITDEISTTVSKVNKHVSIARIDNPIDDNFFVLKNKNIDPVILFVAAIVKRKGLHLLLEAFARIVTRIPKGKLRIAGIWNWDPLYVEGLMQQYKLLIANGSVAFLGPISQEQLYEELSMARVLALPSYAESAPMVIAQAMAAGKPVVASRVGGIPNMVKHDYSGYLINSGDVGALESALEKTLKNKKIAEEMGINAKNDAIKKYHSATIAAMTYKFYSDIASLK